MPLAEDFATSIANDFVGSYVALYEVAPDDENDGVEVYQSGEGYMAQPSTIEIDLADPTTATNTQPIVFSNMPDVSVTAIALLNGSYELLHYSVLTSPKNFSEGDSVTLPAGSITVSVEGTA